MSVELVEAISNSVPDPTNVVDILGRLVWMTEDNGHSIFEVLKSWLRDGDIRRVKIALRFDEVFLWNSDSEMESLLGPLAERFPAAKDDCISARGRWRVQFPNPR